MDDRPATRPVPTHENVEDRRPSDRKGELLANSRQPIRSIEPDRTLPVQASSGSWDPDLHPDPVAEFSSFYRRFVKTLVAFLIWQGASLADAADIAQETMRLAFTNWNSIRIPEAWARRVASREYIRRVSRVEEDPFEKVPETPLLRQRFDTEEWEQRQQVLHVLALLPPRQRQVLAWTYDGYGPTEIAEELKITPEAVRSNLRKARQTLAARLRNGEGDLP